MDYRVIQVNKDTKRSLVLGNDGHYALVNKVYPENTYQVIPEDKLWAMPSFLFGVACLYEPDLETAVMRLEKDRDTKWGY